jgi:hypothetical protein
VAPRGERPPFVVQAGDVRVRVVGTRFGVSRGRDAVTVDVTKGIVEVESHGEIQRVGAGQRWSSSVGLAAPPVPPVAIAPVASLESGSPRPVDPVAALDATGAPTSASTAVVASPQTRPSAAAHVRSSRVQRRNLASAPGEPAASSVAPAPAPTLAGTSRQAQYERAAKMEVNDPEGALAIYRRLAEGGDGWADYSLFAAGHVAFERGTGGEAEELFEEYLRRFPRGRHVAEVHDYLANLRRMLAR